MKAARITSKIVDDTDECPGWARRILDDHRAKRCFSTHAIKCCECGEVFIGTSDRCPECRKSRRSQLENERLKAGLCVRCGKRTPMNGRVRCSECITTQVRYRRTYRRIMEDSIDEGFDSIKAKLVAKVTSVSEYGRRVVNRAREASASVKQLDLLDAMSILSDVEIMAERLRKRAYNVRHELGKAEGV